MSDTSLLGETLLQAQIDAAWAVAVGQLNAVVQLSSSLSSVRTLPASQEEHANRYRKWAAFHEQVQTFINEIEDKEAYYVR